MRSPPLVPLLVVAAGLLHPAQVTAQTPRGIALPPRADALLRAGDDAHTGLRPHRALEAYQHLLADQPLRYDALWRAARESVNLGMLASTGEERKARYSQAEEYARRAREVEPSGVEGAEWLAITLGRAALDQGPRARVRYAEESREAALEVLALDSTNAGGHHVLGMWHAEIRRLSGVERWVADRILGGGVTELASWDAAEEHLRAAVRLDPGGLIHHLALARIYLDRDRVDQAREELRQVLERPAVEPVDPLHKQAAQNLLHGLRSEGRDDELPPGGVSWRTSPEPPAGRRPPVL